MDGDRHAADAGDRGARPRGDRRLARLAGRPPPRRRHARPHARPARAADHVRLQGVAVGGGAAPSPRADRAGAAAPGGRSARRRGRDAVGVGPAGLELQRRVLERLGLGVPDTSWTNARDRVAELVGLLGLVTGTLAKIGNEVYNLQRPEIGELGEAPTDGRRRQHHDAAEAQPGALRAPLDARPRGAGGRRAWRSRGWWPSTSATAPRGRLSGRCCRRRAAPRPSRWRWPRTWPPGCASTSSGCARTSTPSAATSSPSRRCSRSAPRSARAGRTSWSTARLGLGSAQTLREALAADPEIAALLSPERLEALLRPELALGAADELVRRVLGDG